MSAWLQLCPHCGYCAPRINKLDGEIAFISSDSYHAVLKDERLPRLARRFRARALLVAGVDVALRQLQAAWVCDDEGVTEMANECRRDAAAALEALRPFEENEEGFTRSAILIDILRRSAEFARAADECQALLKNPVVQGIVRSLVELQDRLVRERNRQAHSMDEIAQ